MNIWVDFSVKRGCTLLLQTISISSHFQVSNRPFWVVWLRDWICLLICVFLQQCDEAHFSLVISIESRDVCGETFWEQDWQLVSTLLYTASLLFDLARKEEEVKNVLFKFVKKQRTNKEQYQRLCIRIEYGSFKKSNKKSIPTWSQNPAKLRPAVIMLIDGVWTTARRKHRHCTFFELRHRSQCSIHIPGSSLVSTGSFKIGKKEIKLIPLFKTGWKDRSQCLHLKLKRTHKHTLRRRTRSRTREHTLHNSREFEPLRSWTNEAGQRCCEIVCDTVLRPDYEV